MRVEDFPSEASDKCPVCQEEDWDSRVARFHVLWNFDKAGNIPALKTRATKARSVKSAGPRTILVDPVCRLLRLGSDP